MAARKRSTKKLKVAFADEVYLALSGLSVIVSLFKAPLQPINDSALFEFFGRAMLHGQRLYVDLRDNKPPSIYLVNELWQALFGSNYFLHNCAEAALNLSSIALFALMLRRLRVLAWAQGTFLFALFFSLPFPQFNFTQHYAVFFIVLGLYLHFRGADFWAGIAIVAASTFWIPASLTCIPIFAQRLERRRAIAFAAGFGGILLAGAAAAVILFGRRILVAVPSVWENYLQGSVGYNIEHLDFSLAHSTMLPSIAALLGLLGLVLRKPVGETSRFALTWSACALGGSFIPPSFSEHYYLPSIPALAMAVASFSVTAKDFARRPIVAVLTAALFALDARQTVLETDGAREDAVYAQRVGTWIRASIGSGAAIFTSEYFPEIQLASDSRTIGPAWRSGEPIPDVLVAGPFTLPDVFRAPEPLRFTFDAAAASYVRVCGNYTGLFVRIYARTTRAAAFHCDRL